MRSHIAVGALVLAAPAFITAAPIAAVCTVAQPYAVEWRWASALLPSVPLPMELTEAITGNAAGTIPTDLATRSRRTSLLSPDADQGRTRVMLGRALIEVIFGCPKCTSLYVTVQESRRDKMTEHEAIA